MSASWVGSGDQTHSGTGFIRFLPLPLRARRFHTMCPVCLAFAGLLAAGIVTGPLVAAAVLLAGVLIMVRNVYGVVSVLVTGAPAVFWVGSFALIGAGALVLAGGWLLF